MPHTQIVRNRVWDPSVWVHSSRQLPALSSIERAATLHWRNSISVFV